jgi:hypothetical protein
LRAKLSNLSTEVTCGVSLNRGFRRGDDGTESEREERERASERERAREREALA